MPQNIEPSDFENIQNSEETWVIDFWAEWCAPCKKLSPVFEEVSEEIEDVNFGKVDMQENQELGTKLGVRALPTLVIIKDGKELSRKSGAMQKEELAKWIKQNS